MKNLLCTLLCCTLLLAGCNKDLAEHTPAGAPENNAALFLAPQHFYGTAYSDLVTKGVAQADKIWPTGSTITVKFLNDDFKMAAQVEEWAKEWEQYANITIDFVDPSQQADVRIGFDWNDNRWITWSYIGTDCLTNTDQGDATISYAFWDTATSEEKKGDVLRTFGQVLGLELEHRHLDFDPGWVSEAQVRKFWSNDIEDIPWSDLQKYVYTPLEQAGTLQSENYDPQSIMIWPFGAQYAANTQRYFNYVLSETDKAFIATLYPEDQEDEGWIAKFSAQDYLVASLITRDEIVIDWGNGLRDTLPDSDGQYISLWSPEGALIDNKVTARMYGSENALVYFWGDNICHYTEVDVSGCTDLDVLSITRGSLQRLDVSNNPRLRYLNIEWVTDLEELDLTQNQALEYLGVYSPVKSILFSNHPLLTEAVISATNIDELNLPLAHLKTLRLDDNALLSSVDFSPCTELETLYSSNAPFTHLDFTGNPNLKTLVFSTLYPSTVDLSANGSLETLECNGGLVGLDVSANLHLKTLILSRGYYPPQSTIDRLDLSANSKLENVSITNTRIEELILGEHPVLKQLVCTGTSRIPSMDVSGCPVLQRLQCSDNLISHIDVSNNPELTLLSCDGNLISELDVRINKKLIYLYCYSNSINTIDVSNNTALTFFYCDDNPIVTDQAALVAMAQGLPTRTSSSRGNLRISNTTSAGWIRDICSGKNWNLN